MRWIIRGLIVLLAAYLSLVVYANRALFFSRFDSEYWQDRFEHSQWSLPISQRTIGDDGLYLYQGYRLIRGGDPTTSDAEVPPFGKYLIGLSIILFGNGYFYGFFSVAALLRGVYILAKKLTGQKLPALIITLLLATDPLITAQATLTMLDILQGVALVWFLILLFTIPSLKQKYQTAIVVVAGVVLGLFSEVKFPILTPAIGLVSLWYLWTATKKRSVIILFTIGGLVGYLLPYAMYFTQGHTLIEWVRVQKWIVSFYRQSAIKPTWGSAITTLLIGKYQNIISRGWETASGWSPTWGLMFIAVLSSFVVMVWRKNGNKIIMVTYLLLLTSIGIFAVIPFWVRYLVAVLPLLYIVGGSIIFTLPRTTITIIVSLLFIINASISLQALFPTPRDTAQQYIYNAEHLFFSDIYQDTTTSYKKTLTRQAFNHFGLSTMSAGEVESISIRPITTAYSRKSPQSITLRLTYHTRRLGEFSRVIHIPMVLEDNKWRIPWQWSFMLPQLSDSSHLVTTVVPATRGSIISKDGKAIASDEKGYMVWVTPGKVQASGGQKLFLLLETVFENRMPAVAIEHRIVGNSLPDIPVPVGVISAETETKYYRALTAFPAVTATDSFVRAYHQNNGTNIGIVRNSEFTECCSYLYSTTTYDGISGLEYTWNTELKGGNGGTLMLVNERGQTVNTLIDVVKKDGSNTRL